MPGSIDEYSESLQQASEVPVFSLSSDDDDDDDDDDSGNGSGSGGTGGIGYTGGKSKNKGMSTKMSIHTISSSCAHLIGLLLYKEIIIVI